MATIKAVKKKTSSHGGLKKSIDYIKNPEKTDNGILIDGYNCTPENAYNEFLTIKELRENDTGVMAHHFTQNFDPNDNITPERALELGKELAENKFKGHQVIIATHIDKNHIHNHLIVNSVNYETGQKLINNNKLLEQLKSFSDKQCERENLNIVDRKKKSKEFDYGIYDKKKYEVITRAIKGERQSYIYDIANAVDRNIKMSKSKEEFIENMEKEGYKVKWSDTRKYVTYEDKEGQKVRDSNLAKTFNEENFKKEEMLKQFEKNKQDFKEDKKEIKVDQDKLEKIKIEMDQIEKRYNDLKNERAELKEEYKNINDKLDKINDFRKYEKEIKQHENSIEQEKKKKKGYSIFNRTERKNCDVKIQRSVGAISTLKDNLLKLGKENSVTDEEMERIRGKKIALDNQLEIIENKMKEEKELEKILEYEKRIEEEKEKKNLDNQRIPMNFREKDIEEDKKAEVKKVDNKEKVAEVYKEIKKLGMKDHKLKDDKVYQEKLKKAKEMFDKYNEPNENEKNINNPQKTNPTGPDDR